LREKANIGIRLTLFIVKTAEIIQNLHEAINIDDN